MTPTPDSARSLLSAQVTVRYPGKAPVLCGISLEIARGEVVGLVGQSGSGKSTLALAILGLLGRQRAIVEGNIFFQGADLLTMRERELRSLRGRSLSLVLQSPLASLNPALQIRTQLREAWRAHSDSNATGSTARAEDCDRAIQSALASVSLPSDEDDPDFLRKHASQLSVGQAQRVLIAMAIMHRPALLIADEATSALDVITQSEILSCLRASIARSACRSSTSRTICLRSPESVSASLSCTKARLSSAARLNRFSPPPSTPTPGA